MKISSSDNHVPSADHSVQDDDIRNLKLKDSGEIKHDVSDKTAGDAHRIADSAQEGNHTAGDHAPAAQEKKEMGYLESKLRASHLGSMVETGKDLLDKGKELIEHPPLSPIGTDRPLPSIKEGIDRVMGSVEKQVDNASQAADPEKAVDRLKDSKDGSSISLSVAGGATFPVGEVPVGVKVQGKMELKKDGGKYVLTSSGDLAGQLAKSLKGGEAAAGVGAGGSVEMTFDSPEEAKRAMRILSKGSYGGGPKEPISDMAKAGGMTWKDVEPLIPSKEDAEFLKSKTSAIEVKSSIAAQAVLSSAASEQINVAGFSAQGQGTVQGTLRLEMKNGEPTALVVKTSAENTGSVSASMGGFGVQGGVKNTTTVTAEYRFPVDKDFPADKVMNTVGENPFSRFTPAEKKSFEKAARNQEVSLTVASDTSLDASGSGAGIRTEVKITANQKGYWADPKNQEKIRELVQKRDASGALKEMGEGVGVEAKVQLYNKTGVSFKPSLKVEDVGVSAEVEAGQQNVQETRSFKGSATDIAGEIGKYQTELQRRRDQQKNELRLQQETARIRLQN